jgi:hypothetical protein
VSPTHVLTVEVPLSLEPEMMPYDYDPVKDAVQLVLAVSRAGFSGHICDGVQVSVEEVANG